MSNYADKLVHLARSLAGADADFQVKRGPGDGDRATAAFLAQLQRLAFTEFGFECWEKKICGATAYSVDFYFPDEATIVEVALGLPNPSSEFEKDIFKAIIAKDYCSVDRLVLISRAGGEKKCRQPGRNSLREWASDKHRLKIEVCDLPGEPRTRERHRRRRSTAA